MSKRNYPYTVVLTAFHGGGIVSQHYSLDAAERSAKKNQVQGCECGCTSIVLTEDVDKLPTAEYARSPYSAARR